VPGVPTFVKKLEEKMGAKLVKFSVESFPETRVIGKSAVVKTEAAIDDRTIEELWEGMVRDGDLDFLLGLPVRATPSPDTVGWMGDWQPGAETYTYLAGILAQANASVPEGYVYRDIAGCEMAVGWLQEIEGDEGGNIHADASYHINKAMQEHGYEFDGSHGLFEMEYYSHERFRIPEECGEHVILDFYSPCKKAR
jgi:predicted transcriptional regulator YdeE